MILTSLTTRGKKGRYFEFRANHSKKACYFEGGYNLETGKAWALSKKNGIHCSG